MKVTNASVAALAVASACWGGSALAQTTGLATGRLIDVKAVQVSSPIEAISAAIPREYNVNLLVENTAVTCVNGGVLSGETLTGQMGLYFTMISSFADSTPALGAGSITPHPNSEVQFFTNSNGGMPSLGGLAHGYADMSGGIFVRTGTEVIVAASLENVRFQRAVDFTTVNCPDAELLLTMQLSPDLEDALAVAQGDKEFIEWWTVTAPTAAIW